MATIPDLVERMTADGYKLTARKIKYYIEIGLLRKPLKVAAYRKGVHFEYPNEEYIIERLKRIFELKGRGYKLKEIKEILLEEDVKEVAKESAKLHKRFIHHDRKVYRQVNSANLDKLQFHIAPGVKSLAIDLGITSIDPKIDIGDAAMIDKYGLFFPLRIEEKGIHVFELNKDLELLAAWAQLRNEFGIEWKTLKALCDQHRENLSRYVFWPNWSEEVVSWHTRRITNNFPIRLSGYVDRIVKPRLFPGYGRVASDYKYQTLDLFIDDFLEERCAFVPMIVEEERYERGYLDDDMGLIDPGEIFEVSSLFLRRF